MLSLASSNAEEPYYVYPSGPTMVDMLGAGAGVGQ